MSKKKRNHKNLQFPKKDKVTPVAITIINHYHQVQPEEKKPTSSILEYLKFTFKIFINYFTGDGKN